jgi:hypothetical protein
MSFRMNSRPRWRRLPWRRKRGGRLLYGKPMSRLERVQTQIDHFRLMLEGRAEAPLPGHGEIADLAYAVRNHGRADGADVPVCPFILNGGCSTRLSV